MAGRARPRNPPSSIGTQSSRLSIVPGRPSLSRRSSVVYGKSMQARVDPRPINDKSFQVASMRKLVEYFSTHGYGFPISPKLLPSGKDIHNMIEFLIHQADPNFRLVRLEDDVPFFFRTINYPFQISKSALNAAGSPHYWPNLLAALVWIVDLLTCREQEAEKDEQSFNLLNFMEQSYKFYLLGDDDSCSALDEDILAKHVKETEASKREAEQIAQQIMELDSKLQGLKSEASPLLAVETKKSMLLTDVGKFNALIQNLNSHKTGLDKKVEQHKQQTKSKEVELATLTTENHALSQRVSEQTVNVEVFDKMTRELQRYEEDLQSALALKKGKDKETWDLEVLWSKKFKQLEIVALNCNNAMKRLLPIQDSSAGNLCEIQLSSRGETVQDLLGINIKQLIGPQITALQEGIVKSEREKYIKSTDLLKDNSCREDGLNERQALNSQLESKMKEFEAVCKKQQESLESIQSAVDKVWMRIEEEEEKLKTRELESTETFEKTKRETEQLEVAIEQELEQESIKLLAMMESVSSHVEQINARCNVVRAGVVDLKEMVGNNYIRKLKQ